MKKMKKAELETLCLTTALMTDLLLLDVEDIDVQSINNLSEQLLEERKELTDERLTSILDDQEWLMENEELPEGKIELALFSRALDGIELKSNKSNIII